MDAPRVCEDDVGAVDERAEGAVLQRIAPQNIAVALDLRQEVLADFGVAVDRQDEEHLGVVLGQAGDGASDGPHRLAPGLAAVGGHEHDSSGAVLQSRRQVLIGWWNPAVDGDQERVDDGVTRDADGLRVGVLAQQVVPTGGGGTQMQCGHLADEPPVGLLREGRGDITGAQAGLDVEDGDLVVEGCERGGEGRGGVALDHDGVGAMCLDRPTHSLQGTVGDLGEGLSRGVDVEVVVGDDPEELVDLVEHLAVLSGDDDDGVEALVVAHGRYQGGELDRLRAGAVDEHDPQGPARWRGVCRHGFSCSGVSESGADTVGRRDRDGQWPPWTGLTGLR